MMFVSARMLPSLAVSAENREPPDLAAVQRRAVKEAILRDAYVGRGSGPARGLLVHALATQPHLADCPKLWRLAAYLGFGPNTVEASVPGCILKAEVLRQQAGTKPSRRLAVLKYEVARMGGAASSVDLLPMDGPPGKSLAWALWRRAQRESNPQVKHRTLLQALRALKPFATENNPLGRASLIARIVVTLGYGKNFQAADMEAAWKALGCRLDHVMELARAGHTKSPLKLLAYLAQTRPESVNNVIYDGSIGWLLDCPHRAQVLQLIAGTIKGSLAYTPKPQPSHSRRWLPVVTHSDSSSEDDEPRECKSLWLYAACQFAGLLLSDPIARTQALPLLVLLIRDSHSRTTKVFKLLQGKSQGLPTWLAAAALAPETKEATYTLLAAFADRSDLSPATDAIIDAISALQSEAPRDVDPGAWPLLNG